MQIFVKTQSYHADFRKDVSPFLFLYYCANTWAA
ncbi:unnamed protein product [Rhizoctonia solani]|uniref:Uncharacterized protein n=1 Tax=Rhizoctonia solani TaxID=456999 RepID=A0A8H3CKU2_9AGAM|nr:unnamed protein product [Rhizoctonia solani]